MTIRTMTSGTAPHCQAARNHLKSSALRKLTKAGCTIWDVTVMGDVVLLHFQKENTKDWIVRLH